MDVENLDAGQAFDDLPDTYTIFITEHDIFDEGLPIYHVERMMLETEALFDDGEHIMYVNGEYRDDSEIGQLMHDFCCSDPNQMLLELFRDVTRYYKETEKGVTTMCKAMEDMRNESIQYGENKRSFDIAKNLISMGILTFEQIAQATKLSIEQVKELAGA